MIFLSIASFQGKIFSVSSTKVYSLAGLTLGSGLETEAQEKLQDKPSTYIKGESLSTMSFEIPLRSDFGINPRKQIEEWEAIKSNAHPAVFILGTRPIGKNKWLLKTVNTNDVELDGRGNILKATLKLEFEEYVRAGKASSKSSSSGTAIGTSASIVKPDSYLYDPVDKAIKKRNNPNMASNNILKGITD